MHHYLKSIVKWPLRRFYVEAKKMKRPILLVSTRRSGSTLLMESIYSNDKVGYIDQPFDFWKSDVEKGGPVNGNQKIINCQSSDNKKLLFKYLTELLSGKRKAGYQWNIFDNDFSTYVDRYVIKMLNGKSIVPYIKKEINCKVLYLFRHPISVAKSVINLGWGENVSCYLEKGAYPYRVLDDESLKLCKEIISNSDKFDKLVLQWILENLPILDIIREKECLFITYEEMVFRPYKISKWIASELNLDDPDMMYKRLKSPSKTTDILSRQEMAKEGAKEIVSKRFSESTTKQRKRVDYILGALDIEMYKADTPFPSKWATKYGKLAVR